MYAHIWLLIKRTFQQWREDRVSRLSAALAYYAIFSLAPLLIIVVSVAGTVYGKQAARGQVKEQMARLTGQSAADAIDKVLRKASSPGSGSLLATALGSVVLLYGATKVVAELQDSMNTIWGVQRKPGQRYWKVVQDRLLSALVVLGIACLLLLSLAFSAALSALGKELGAGRYLWRVVDSTASLAVFSIICAAIFKWIPDVQIRWKDAWLGAGLTAALFTAGKVLLGVYLGHSLVVSVYGAAGSVVVLLIWVYYSAQVLFLGAEFVQVYARRSGHPITPRRGAMLVRTWDRRPRSPRD